MSVTPEQPSGLPGSAEPLLCLLSLSQSPVLLQNRPHLKDGLEEQGGGLPAMQGQEDLSEEVMGRARSQGRQEFPRQKGQGAAPGHRGLQWKEQHL